MKPQPEERRSTRARWQTPALVFVVVWAVTATPLVWAHLSAQQRESELIRSQTQFAGRVSAKHIREHVLLRIAAARSLALEARGQPTLITTDVRARAEALHRALPGVQAINWIDPAGRIAWVVPSERNAAALGKSPLDNPLAKPSFEQARQSLTVQVTQPLALFQGGVGVAAYIPIRQTPAEADLGVINVVFRLDTLGELLFDPYTAKHFNLTLKDDKQSLLEYGPAPEPSRSFVSKETLAVHNARWDVVVEPGRELLNTVRRTGVGAWTWFSLLSTLGIATLAALYKFVADERARRSFDLELANETLGRAAALVGQDATLELHALQDLLRQCCLAMGVSRAALWTFEERSGSLNLIAMFDRSAEKFYFDVKVYVADYPDYWAAMSRDGRVVVKDAALDPVTSKLHAERMPELARLAMLDVGIRSKERFLGLFSFHRTGATNTFRPEERMLAQSMADLFALSWERAEKRRTESEVIARNQRLARHSAALGEMTVLLTRETEFEQLIPQAVRVVADALRTSSVTYWSLSRQGPELEVERAFGVVPAATDFTRTLKCPTIAQRIRNEACVVVNDMAADPDYVEFYQENCIELGKVAILQSGVSMRQHVSGVLSVIEQEPPSEWFPEDPIFVASVANMLSLHLEMRARSEAEQALSQQVAALVRHSEALTNIAKAWLSEVEQDRRFASLTEIAAHALDSTTASVWLESRPGFYRLVERYSSTGGPPDSGEELATSLAPEYYARLVSERSVSIVDAANDSSYGRIHAVLFKDEPHVSVLASIVRRKGAPVGLVSFLSLGRLRDWTMDEQLFAAALADFVSLGFEQEARHRAEQSMRESQQRSRLLFEGTPLAAIDWSTTGRVVGWNPAAERLFGYTREEAIGLAYRELFPTRGHDSDEDAWQELKSGVNIVERLWTHTKGKRELACDWRNTLLSDEDGRELGVMSLVEDVTARVRAEEEIKQLTATLERRVEVRTSELAEANRQLRELDRLKNEFLATMSHELRTPLNSVIGFSSILKAGMAGPVNDEQGRQLEMINQSARHLLGLINDLLDLSRIEAGHVRLVPTDVDPGGVLSDVERTLRPMIESKAALAPFRFTVVNHAMGSVLRTDRTRLLQILLNLANNAVKFTQEGSVVVELASENEGLVFHVRDTGPGISPENLRHLFEAFRQIDSSARRAYEGTGLGLYLCRKLSRLLGGEVRVTSELGVGSCFSLWLPLRSSECAS